MTLDFKIESLDEIDFQKTSELACRAFNKSGPELSTARFEWSYTAGFAKAFVAAAFENGEKVGQAAALVRPLVLRGRTKSVAELVDLFVSPSHRNFATVSRIYRELRAALADAGVNRIYTYPNAGARQLNRRFFKLEQMTALPIHLGFAGVGRSPRRTTIEIVKGAPSIAEALEDYSDKRQNEGLTWTGPQLRCRLASPWRDYALARTEDVAVLASPRRIRGLPVLLICASFSRDGKKSIRATDRRDLVTTLGANSGRYLYLYGGWNRGASFRSGLRMPRQFLAEKFVVQSNFLNNCNDGVPRFELIDLDYG